MESQGKHRVQWNPEERGLIAAEALKVLPELQLSAPLKDGIDLIRVVGLAQRVLPVDRQRKISDVWRALPVLPELREVGVVRGRMKSPKGVPVTQNHRTATRRPKKRRVRRMRGVNMDSVATQPLMDAMLKIEKNIPIPGVNRQSTFRAFFATMVKGDSVRVPFKRRYAARDAASAVWGKGSYVTRTIDKDFLRIWRVK